MIPEKVKRILDAYNLHAVEFEESSTSTASQAAHKFGVEVGQIAKSLLFIGKNGTYYLAVCSGDRKIISSKMKKVIGMKSRMANRDETFAATGFLPGGVCPFGVGDIKIIIDTYLARFETIYPAAGTDSSGVPMTFNDLVKITEGVVCDFTDSFENTTEKR